MMNELYKNGWSALPRSVFISPDDRLNAMARLVLMCLLAHRNDVTGLCNPSQHTIARECGISVRSVGDALRLLIDTAYISVDETIKGRTNAYVFVFEIPHPSQTSALHADMDRVSQTSALCADKQQNNQSVVINNTTTWEQPVTDCSSDVFIFDQHLHNADLSLIAFVNSLLTGIPNAQTVLDEFNFQIGEKKQQGAPIRNPQGYLTRLVKLAATGEFTPSGALDIAARRKARNARKPVAVAATPKPVQAAVETVTAQKAQTIDEPAQHSEAIKQPSNAYTPSDTGKSAIAALRASLGQPKHKKQPDGVPSIDEQIAISAALRGMGSGQRGGSGFQAIGKLIRGSHEA